MILFLIPSSRYTLTLQNMESHERLKSGFMVNDFSSKEIFYESFLFQRHPLFFERTTSLVTMEEKTGAEVRPSGWYNLGAVLIFVTSRRSRNNTWFGPFAFVIWINGQSCFCCWIYHLRKKSLWLIVSVNCQVWPDFLVKLSFPRHWWEKYIFTFFIALKFFFSSGEYVADRNFSVMPHDPFLDMSYPRPLREYWVSF